MQRTKVSVTLRGIIFPVHLNELEIKIKMLTSFWLTFHLLRRSKSLRHYTGCCFRRTACLRHECDITREPEPKNTIKKSNKISCFFNCWAVTHFVNAYGQDLENHFSLPPNSNRMLIISPLQIQTPLNLHHSQLNPVLAHICISQWNQCVYMYCLRIITVWHQVCWN